MAFPPGSLPTNVSVLCPADPTVYTNLDNATFFTRIQTRHSHQELARTLSATPAVKQTFCTIHLGIIVIFDSDKTNHTGHVRTVLQMLQDSSMKANLAGCVFDAPDAAKAGFKFDKVGSGDKRALMIIDLGRPSATSSTT